MRRFHPPAGRFEGVIGGPPCQSFSTLVHLVRIRGNEPRFGNLIPEFERCVGEAAPEWFLMENVPSAPIPAVAGYSVTAFLLEHDALDSGDGLGHEQMRTRRFSFGRRGRVAKDLRQWIQLAALRLPKVTGAITQCSVDNSDEAKGRVRRSAVIGHGGATPEQRRPQRLRKHSVFGGSSGITAESERRRRVRQKAVCSGHGASLAAIESGGGFKRHSLEEAIRLQGLPEGFLTDAPFLKDAKRDVVAAGVPIPIGRAIARAIKAALDLEATA